jgi:hypothetical protein
MTDQVETIDPRAHLATVFRLQAAGCRHMGSPFYADLCERCALDAETGDAVLHAMGEHATAPFDVVYHLRLLGGLHRMAITGESPELRAHFPSTGGDGDVDAAWRAIVPLLREMPPSLVDALGRGVQTNEVGRAAPLAGGLAVVSARAVLPLRLLEIGSSAGLILRLDRYWFEADGAGWGDRASRVRFVDEWDGGAPPFAALQPIASRRGCDLAPIDVTAPGADVTLLSFVWPGQDHRFTMLRDALAIARDVPVTVDRAAIDEWLPAQLASPVPGVATVVFHSIVWQYLSTETRDLVVRTVRDAGRRATEDAPLAWLRLEPGPNMAHAELHCTYWPGDERRLLATASFHAGRVNWLASGAEAHQ